MEVANIHSAPAREDLTKLICNAQHAGLAINVNFERDRYEVVSDSIIDSSRRGCLNKVAATAKLVKSSRCGARSLETSLPWEIVLPQACWVLRRPIVRDMSTCYLERMRDCGV